MYILKIHFLYNHLPDCQWFILSNVSCSQIAILSRNLTNEFQNIIAFIALRFILRLINISLIK